MSECRTGVYVNYCITHLSSWEAYDDNETPCDLARAESAEVERDELREAVKRVREVCKNDPVRMHSPVFADSRLVVDVSSVLAVLGGEEK